MKGALVLFTMSGQLTFSIKMRNTVWIFVRVLACALANESKINVTIQVIRERHGGGFFTRKKVLRCFRWNQNGEKGQDRGYDRPHPGPLPQERANRFPRFGT